MRHWPRGVIGPEDLDMLARVLQKTLPPGSTEIEEDWHAAVILRAFQAGMIDEATLVANLQGKPPPAG